MTFSLSSAELGNDLARPLLRHADHADLGGESTIHRAAVTDLPGSMRCPKEVLRDD